MQPLTVSTSQKSPSKLADARSLEPATQTDWISMYDRKPTGNSTLFELEAMVAKRMEFLAWVDQLMNSPKATSFDSILDTIGARLPEERRSRAGQSRSSSGTILGYAADDEQTGAAGGRRPSSAPAAALSTQYSADAIVFEPNEDLASHLLCRFAFCMSERWGKWYVRTEEVLLRARLKLEIAKSPFAFLVDLMKRNGLPCAPLTEKESSDVRVQEYLAYRRVRAEGQRESAGRVDSYYTVPLPLATRLVRSRQVLCHRGRAVLFRDQVQEVFVTVFRNRLNRGLHDSYLARVKLQSSLDESERATVMSMLDVFLEQFISDPADALQEGAAGTLRAGDVQAAAQTHFPLCMRLVDTHLRRSGHLKHHGRFTYGLFLKAIGLSLEDSLALFSTLMTVKGGESVEAFSKTAYGYNVRHNYGMEGKKTSYSSASCVTVIGLPPVVDRDDCHGCPFRTCDEASLRVMLGKDQRSPLGSGFPDVRPGPEDIEDIVKDAKAQHYTRACYKYFMATHAGARRDTLFRSPYEYYCVSKELEGNAVSESQTPSHGKRTSVNMATPILSEDNTRRRL